MKFTYTLVLIFSLVSAFGAMEPKTRIVSMSPAITETLFYFALEKNLVGVSDFCRIPGEKKGVSKSVSRLGSPFAPQIERLVALKPTDVLTQNIKDTKFVTMLEKLKIPFSSFDFNGLDEIQRSINAIVKKFKGIGLEDFNTQWLQAQYKLRKMQLAGNYLPVIGLKGELESLKGFVVAGDDTYLGEIVTSTGLTNLAPQKKGYGDIGLETFLKLKLHYLFFFTRDKSLEASAIERQIKKQFKLKKVPKVFVFSEDYTLIPGPNVIKLMNEVSNVLN